MRKSIATLLVIMLGVSLLAGCSGGGGGGGGGSGGNRDVLMGIWEGQLDPGTDYPEDVVWEFDGRGGLKFTNNFLDKSPGTYTITGNTVELKVDVWSDPIVYEFKNEGSTLTMVNDEFFRPNYELTKK